MFAGLLIRRLCNLSPVFTLCLNMEKPVTKPKTARNRPPLGGEELPMLSLCAFCVLSILTAYKVLPANRDENLIGAVLKAFWLCRHKARKHR